MGRAIRVAAVSAVIFVAWFVALFHTTFLPSMTMPKWADEILPVLPLWSLVAFGSYSLGNIGLALVTFRDCPEAHRSLLKEIKEAKENLRLRGVTVD